MCKPLVPVCNQNSGRQVVLLPLPDEGKGHFARAGFS
jgi:hypothetical protein